MKIDKVTIQKTENCKKDFECLSNNNHNFCKVVERLANVVFVNPTPEILCNYKLSFGQETICTCPTRKEIYNKYCV